jgi:hypothetical protein
MGTRIGLDMMRLTAALVMKRFAGLKMNFNDIKKS